MARLLPALPIKYAPATSEVWDTDHAAAMMGMLAGCNTVEGAGKDVKATGAAVERAADKAKPN